MVFLEYPNKRAEPGKWRAALEALLIMTAMFVFLTVNIGWLLPKNPPPRLTVALVASPSLKTEKQQPSLKEQIEQAKEKLEKIQSHSTPDTTSKIKEAEIEAPTPEEETPTPKPEAEPELEIAEEPSAPDPELIDIYRSRIKTLIERGLQTPSGIPSNARVVLLVRLGENGLLIGDPELIDSSGYPEYDKEAIRAIVFAQPLPVPSQDPKLMEEFRELRIDITPRESQ